MYRIVSKEKLQENIVYMEIFAPRIAQNCQPGQFLIVMADEFSERIPLTLADYDREKQTVSVVVQLVGESTRKLASFGVGDCFQDVVGPLGKPSEFVYEEPESIRKKRYLFIGGGLGCAPVYPQVKWMKEHGVAVDVIMGARNKDLLFWEERMRAVANEVFVTTDDGSAGRAGQVTHCLEHLVTEEKKRYDQVVVIGPMVMMKFVCALTAPARLNIPTTVSMNPIMVDGTGMCGACRLMIDGELKFACVDGPEFDGHKIHFDEAMARLKLYRTPEGREQLEREEGEPLHRGGCRQSSDMPQGFDVWRRVPISEQEPAVRATNFDEVCLGYTPEEAMLEASRCLDCKKPKCVSGCPVAIDIPGFIREVHRGDFAEAYRILSRSTSLPAVCGRVCPQEEQCEGVCVRKAKGDAVAIGKLERFVADWARKEGLRPNTADSRQSAAQQEMPSDTKERGAESDAATQRASGRRVAVIGSGPAGLSCAGDLAKRGYAVTIFESLHLAGGVLQYGIPEFRLPKEEVVAYEIDNVRRLGVTIETDVFVGQSVTLDQLKKEGFEAIFVASGAGLPQFMNIPGENANGVFSANEYLTRSNLMRAYDAHYDTQVLRGKQVCVVGGGNVAMDAARTALRFGAQSHIIYRRSEAELPARAEEVHHAREEGVVFHLLQNPVEILTDDQGWVRGLRCIKMELGEPDASGRRRPQEIPGSEFELEADMVILALGTRSNPIAIRGCDDIQLTPRKGIVVDPSTGMSSVPGIFAGGDAVSGAATVILAMGAGRVAARGIDAYLTGQGK
ncbi:MAG: NADPH-dependent glutamate synthase [Ndongobacter sp.]|nr:NADPH-dependent glutamate synthase [Ndongobacter sp.]